jgi:glycosyltransferase involved in cell wall biosynthesis
MDRRNALPRVVWDMTFTIRSRTGTHTYTHNLYRAVDARQQVELQQVYGTRAVGHKRRGGSLPAAKNMWWLARGLERELNARAPDLFHAAAYLGPRRAPCPVVVNVFDTAYLTYPQYFDWKWHAYARFVIPHTVRNAAAVVTLTEHAREEIIRAYNVPAQRVHIVAPGIGGEFQPEPDAFLIAQLRARYGLRENYLLYLGATNGRKNIPALVEAFARLRAEFPQLTLVLAGPRQLDDAATTQAIRAHAVENTVTRLGHIPQSDLPLLYAGARAFVYASKWEGFGIPPVEAMACGTPVVAAPNPPMPQVLGDAACWANNDSPAALAMAIRRVLNDDALTQTLRDKGIARARMFTWEGAAQALLQIYADVLHSRKKSAHG